MTTSELSRWIRVKRYLCIFRENKPFFNAVWQDSMLNATYLAQANDNSL